MHRRHNSSSSARRRAAWYQRARDARRRHRSIDRSSSRRSRGDGQRLPCSASARNAPPCRTAARVPGTRCRGRSATKSCTVPRYRTAVTATPESRSRRAYSSPSSRTTSASADTTIAGGSSRRNALDAAQANPERGAAVQRMLDDQGLHVTARPAIYQVAVDIDAGDGR